MYLSKFHSGRTSARLKKFSAHPIGTNTFCVSAEKQPPTADGDISCASTGFATASRTWHSKNANLSAMKAGLTIRLSRSACLTPSHLQVRRIERLSASTRGALQRLSTSCKIPPDDHRVRSRRVSSPPMQRSSTSSSQNVHTQQPCSRVVAKARRHSPCTKCRRKDAREPRSSASGGSWVQTCSGGSKKRLSQQTVAMQRSDGDCKACKVKLCQVGGRIEGNASGRRGPRGRKS